MTLAMSGASPSDAGLASGLVNTTQQVGGALGLAILASVAESRTGDATSAAALVDGYGAAFTVLRDERPAHAAEHAHAPAPGDPVIEAA